jgi:murein L,D-transpeptidase YafK
LYFLGVFQLSPEKSETMALLGQDAVRCKILVFVQKIFTTRKEFLKISVVKFPIKIKKNFQQKLAKFFQILGTLKHHFDQLWSKIFQEANWLFAFLYTEAKFGCLEQRMKKE